LHHVSIHMCIDTWCNVSAVIHFTVQISSIRKQGTDKVFTSLARLFVRDCEQDYSKSPGRIFMNDETWWMLGIW